MAGASITIEVKSERLERALDEAARRAVNLTPVFKAAGEHMLRSIDKNFEAEGRPERWRPWSAATLESKMGGRKKTYTQRGQLRAAAQRRLAGDKILTASGRLRRSLTRSSAMRVSRDGLVIGTNVQYAAIHQFGGPAGRKSARVQIPARAYLVAQDEDTDIIAEMIEDYLAEPMK